MKIVLLKELAKIDISNIDKKSKENEQEVILCNFVDVYKNWAITKTMIPNLMKATANKNQIERFSLFKGQVAITKDSETRDDIGMPTYIADNIPNGVLGYHCVLITPNETLLKGKYLNIVLSSPYARKYFEANASGSGQRYTLTNNIIENFPVPLPENISTQEEFGNLCSYIDSKIELNNSISTELEETAKLIYDYWFLQFDFPDKDGKPYRQSGGKMVWNDELKKEIPENWNVNILKNVANIYQPKTISRNELIDNGKYFVYGANGIIGKYDKYNHEENEIAICCRGAGCGLFTMTQPYSWITGNAMVVSPKENIVPKEYLYYGLSFPIISKYITGSAQPQITRTNIEAMPIIIPPKSITNKFDKIAIEIRLKLQNIFNENQELTELRDFLLPMLMNGQVKIKEPEKIETGECGGIEFPRLIPNEEVIEEQLETEI